MLRPARNALNAGSYDHRSTLNSTTVSRKPGTNTATSCLTEWTRLGSVETRNKGWTPDLRSPVPQFVGQIPNSTLQRHLTTWEHEASCCPVPREETTARSPARQATGEPNLVILRLQRAQMAASEQTSPTITRLFPNYMSAIRNSILSLSVETVGQIRQGADSSHRPPRSNSQCPGTVPWSITTPRMSVLLNCFTDHST
jgi:hypothetical protein